MTDPSSDLVHRCQAGDQAAWETLCNEWAGRVYRWAVLLGLNPADAEDASQDVLATAVRRINTCRSSAALSTWLYQITRRTVANRRRLGWFKRVWLMAEDPEPAFELGPEVGLEKELAVRWTLAALSPRHAEVLVLMDIEGFTRDEAAEILALPPGTVAGRLRAARKSFEERWMERASAPSVPQSVVAVEEQA